MTARDPLAIALDCFDVPQMSGGLTDRIVRAVSPSLPAARSSRDRRGLWRRGRHALVGTIAFGMLSAAAVASGLLERVGIEVPVLSAILAPKERPAAKAAGARRYQATAAEGDTHRRATAHSTAAEVHPIPTQVERVRLRVERRERIRAFAEAYPRAAALVAVRVRQELRRREIMRRDALGLPPTDPRAPGFRMLTPEERWIVRAERRRDRRRAEVMLDRRLAARAARLDAARTEPMIASNAAEPSESALVPPAADEGLASPPH